jgi:hypothetical protein
MSEQQELEQQQEQPAESREDELTRKVTRFVEGPVAGILIMIMIYYGGNPGGSSSFVNHALWQDAILWPIVIIGFVLVTIDRIEPRMSRAERQAFKALPKDEKRAERRRRAQSPRRRVSRHIARRIIARRERKGIEP